MFLCIKATKKMFFEGCIKVLNSNAKSRHRRAYHQLHRNCISPRLAVVYHHCEKGYSLRLMICTFGDEIHAKACDDMPLISQWIKKSTSRNLSNFLAGDIGIEPTLRESEARVLPLHQSPAMRSL